MSGLGKASRLEALARRRSADGYTWLQAAEAERRAATRAGSGGLRRDGDWNRAPRPRQVPLEPGRPVSPGWFSAKFETFAQGRNPT